MFHNKIVIFIDEQCEACNLLISLLQENHLKYKTKTNLNVLIRKGIRKIPVVKYRHKYYAGHEAFNCIRKIADDRLNGGKHFGKKKMD